MVCSVCGTSVRCFSPVGGGWRHGVATVWRPAAVPPSRMQASLQQGALAPSQAYGYKVGDLVFYTGQSQTFADGDKVAHGQQGKVEHVLGVLPTQLTSSVPTHLAVRFSGNKGYVGLRFTEVRRLRAASAPPPLPLPACASHADVVPHLECADQPHSAATAKRWPQGGREVVLHGAKQDV